VQTDLIPGGDQLTAVLAGILRVLRLGRTPADGWEPLADSADVGRTLLVCHSGQDGVARTLLVWRTRSGRPVAMEARCPHRQLPMTGGRLVDDKIECPFHHHRFDRTGRCTNVRGARPATVRKVHESGGVLWVRN
jgi:phenylpropionate dioxygenase-like ring-hydroxylating dioxygenase large terminal subunit